jgi:hypothetical protein
MINGDMQLFHTGIIVDDLGTAMASWGVALGLHWAPPKTATTPMRCPDGVMEREVRFSYSVEGPHHIELLQQVDPSPYLSLTGGRHIHHLGYYTRDLAGQSRRLEELGFPCELSGVAPGAADEASSAGGVARATFHRNVLAPGMWIELVDESVASDIDPWMADAARHHGIAYTSPFG